MENLPARHEVQLKGVFLLSLSRRVRGWLSARCRGPRWFSQMLDSGLINYRRILESRALLSGPGISLCKCFKLDFCCQMLILALKVKNGL